MSALGQKRTYAVQHGMSALPLKADMSVRAGGVATSGLSSGGKNGGGSGIRTHVTVSRKHAFQACAFSHSATPPDQTFFTGRISLHQSATRAFALQTTFLTSHRKGRDRQVAGL
jgi:hypothetical protein